jgi:hypothetical protein
MFKVTVKTIARDTGEAVADSTVLSLVRVIEDKVINQIAQKGPSEIEMPLPMQFEDLKDLRNEDAQKLVYGRLFQELDLAGFVSQLIMYENVYMLKIKWRQQLDNNLGRELVSVIARHAVKKESKYDTITGETKDAVKKTDNSNNQTPRVIIQPPNANNLAYNNQFLNNRPPSVAETPKPKAKNNNGIKSFF